ncbi:hypothetical protein [Alkalinema sp. FACHB-956]|uniref:acyl carrier protein n=1 Tax=Alkalinema sp. FACHB-956 TaxID=2692768 RepID=UPI001F5583A6|nr:hypothetical protein [Alkalinema sp. FACHB-956]
MVKFFQLLRPVQFPNYLNSPKGAGNTGGVDNAANFDFSIRMWRKLNNWWQAVRTYPDMRPDLQLRRKINQTLRDRSAYGSHDWYRCFWEPLGVKPELANFLYSQLAAYSGLEVARLLPSDRLIEDLHIPLVCWYDWEWDLCEAFENHFGIELCPTFDLSELTTLKDLFLYLNQKLIQ